MPVLSFLGSFPSIWSVFFLLLGVFGGPAGRRVAVIGIAALIGTTVLTDIVMKEIFVRPRPFLIYPWVDVLVPLPSDFSFPSTHASTVFTAVVVLRYFYRSVFWSDLPVLLMALTISLSRIYVGVHYPIDVLAGAAIGAAVGWLFCVTTATKNIPSIAGPPVGPFPAGAPRFRGKWISSWRRPRSVARNTGDGA